MTKNMTKILMGLQVGKRLITSHKPNIL